MAMSEGMKMAGPRPAIPSQEIPNQQLPKQQLPNQQLPVSEIPTSLPSLTATAVTGAVLLAAGLLTGKPMSAPEKPSIESFPIKQPTPKVVSSDPPTQLPPVDQSKMSKSLQPFIDLGKKVATGEVSCKG
jgi:hypothetical protein